MTALIAYHDGQDGPRTSPFEIADRLGIPDFEVLLGWLPERRSWLEDDRLRGSTYMAGYRLVDVVATGRLRYLPIRLSAVPRWIQRRRPDVGVVTGVPRGKGFAFGSTVAWGPALAAAASRLVIEVDETGMDLGGPMIEGNVVARLDRPEPDDPILTPRPPDADDLAVGEHVASVIPSGATIQVGPGGIAEAVVATTTSPVQVWAGLVTDAMAGMFARGVLDGSIRAAYAWGGEAIADLHAAGRLELLPLGRSHDLTALSALPNYVACNTALQIGLDGSCNVEIIGGRAIAGIGGNADFATAAVRSPGGLSIMALKSTTRSGRSTIVPRVEHVSTPRCDVDLVITEHGIADLRDADDAERARRIIAVAHPDHRESLTNGRGETA